MKDAKLSRRPRRSSSNSSGESTTSSSSRRSRNSSSNSSSSKRRLSSKYAAGSMYHGSNSTSRGSRKRSGGYGRSNRSRSNGRGRSSRKDKTFDVESFIQEMELKARNTADQVVEPIVIKHKFSDFNLPDSLKKSLQVNGFETPTQIQDETIPTIIEGQDVVGIANTGTGKTLAFVLPLAARVINEDKKLRVLIMCPTRELAQQVEAEVAKITSESPLNSVVCVGGMPIGRQIRALKKNPEFVIGTPGRLKDLLDRRVLRLDLFSAAILDEADQMLDMGFIHDMRYILEELQDNRQTLLFSATMSDEIKRLIKDFTNNAKVVSVKTQETAHTIDQSVKRLKPGEDKVEALAEIIKHDETGKTIIFCRTKRGADRLSRDLKRSGINADSIHGDRTQRQRTRTLNRFRSHAINVLVATDVAARGLDIDDITHVINYDAPQTRDDYVHRIGRTGRAGSKGSAITFV